MSVPLTSWQRRLAAELHDDGVEIPGEPDLVQLVLEELDHCRRPTVFEGQQATYGAIVVPSRVTRAKPPSLPDHFAFDVVPLEGDPALARPYADGRASYLVRDQARGVALACFARGFLFEADLVHLQELTGAAIVQRTPVLSVPRLFIDGAVVVWDGRHWRSRPTASSLYDAVDAAVPEDDSRIHDILELAIHWLAPSRVGATIVLGHEKPDYTALDTSTAARTPPLSMTNRRHFAAIAAVLRQHDLAVVVQPDGMIRKVAVGLRWSAEAERVVDNDRGMRHRSAQRYSFDQANVTVVVVSEDGPVTVYRHGEAVVTTGPAVATPTDVVAVGD